MGHFQFTQRRTSMNRLSLLLGSALFAAALAVPALAADYGPSGMGMEMKEGQAGMGMGQMKGEPGKGRMMGDCLMDREGMGGECLMLGRHKMTGKVSMINHAKGTLVLKNSVVDMTLHFPPDSIKTLKNGDNITVYLGFRMAEPPSVME
jgi:hypothetical protein